MPPFAICLLSTFYDGVVGRGNTPSRTAKLAPVAGSLTFEVHPTGLDGVLLIEPKVYRDERGFFLEVYQKERFRQLGVRTAGQARPLHGRSHL